MNILGITPYFYPKIGGLENYSLRILLGLRKKGHNIIVLTTIDKEHKNDHLKLFESYNGIKIIRVIPNFYLSNTPISFFSFKIMLKQLLKKLKIDIAILHTPVPFIADISAPILKKYKIPVIITYHNDLIKINPLLNQIAKFYSSFITKKTLEISNIIITPSPYCFRESRILKKFKDKLVYIPPGIDPEDSKRKKLVNSKAILFIGQLNKGHKFKGVDLLILAFKKVLKKHPDAKLRIIGDGNWVPELKELVNNMDLNKSVFFLGRVGEKELINEYLKAHTLVLPTRIATEGFGMVIIEAWLYQTPVIGTKVGGIKYLIEDQKDGLLVPPNNIQALKDALLLLLDNPELAMRLGINGYKKVIKSYNWKKSIEKTNEVIYRLLKDNKKRF